MLCDYQYIEKAPINIEPREVLRLQGYDADLQQISDDIQYLVKRQIDNGYKLIQPRAVYRIFTTYIFADGKVKTKNGSEFCIGRDAQKWVGLKYLALAICTIGQALEKTVSKLFSDGEYASAVILDSVGSVAVENLADYINNEVCQQASSKGLTLTHRISPGYGDWALDEQRIVFSLLPSDKMEVTLTKSCMMQPRKSISFLLGIVEDPITEKDKGKCLHCDMVNCPYRIGDN